MLLKIGALAKRAGLTVRALHHYDAIGLLSPSARSDNGSRLYNRNDVIRLHRIQALKHFDCSLSDIRVYLDESGPSPIEIIDRQISVLDEQARRAQALRDSLQRLKDKIASGGETGVTDWLNLMEMMTMYEKHLTKEELDQLSAQQQSMGPSLNARWADLIAEIRKSIDLGLPPESQDAQALAWHWLRLAKDVTGDNAQIAAKLKTMQKQEKRAQEINGLKPDILEWITLSVAHARTALFAKYLSPIQLEEVLRRQIAHINDWQFLFAEVRQQMDAGAAEDDPDVRVLARRWQDLFRDSYCGDDLELESKVRLALQHEPDLMLGVGLDFSLFTFIQKAIFSLNRPQYESDNAGPKPSAQRVATLRAAHQLLDNPLVLQDPLALKILGSKDEAALRANPEQYNDLLSKGLRTSLVVRSRLAEDEFEKAGVRQYVILGAGLDTYAYRAKHQTGRVFEVDLPETQQWKRDCLRTTDIRIPDTVTYVPIDFEQDTLAHALSQAGFRQDQPAFFSWLGVTMYLEEDAIMDTMRFIASCAAGSAVVFDYLVTPSLLTPMERMVLELISAKVAERGEPWKTFFDPEALAEKLRLQNFSAANNLSPEHLNDRYLSGRKDGLRMGSTSRLMHAVV